MHMFTGDMGEPGCSARPKAALIGIDRRCVFASTYAGNLDLDVMVGWKEMRVYPWQHEFLPRTAESWTLGGSSFAVVWGTSRVSGASGASLNTFMVAGAGVVGQ